jgi:hypothetical protein
MTILSSFVWTLLPASISMFIIYKTFKIYIARKKLAHLPGPPTKGILGFYLGNLDEAIVTINEGKVLADLMLKWYVKD